MMIMITMIIIIIIIIVNLIIRIKKRTLLDIYKTMSCSYDSKGPAGPFHVNKGHFQPSFFMF